jgi:tungstate transport system ATP-binding protein
MRNTLYHLKDVAFLHGNRTCLDIDDLKIQRGKATCLLGPNGSGKSTLLGILAFLSTPFRGNMLCANTAVDFSDKDMLHRLRRKVVLVDQHPVLFSTSVCGNVEYGLKMRGLERKERKKRSKAALERVGLSHLIDRKSHRLSGGETQRIALARALALKPEVMLIDEPTASVDAEHQVVIEGIMNDIVSSGDTSIVFSTHDERLADTLAEERILLDGGRLVRDQGDTIFSADVVEGPGGAKQCLIGGVALMTLRTEKTGPRKIALDMAKIILNPNGAPLPRGSRINGRVLQMVEQGEFIRLKLDVGTPLNLVVSKDEVRRRCFFVGDEIQAFIPEDAVRTL